MVIIIVVMCHKRRRSKPTQELAATAYDEDHHDNDAGFIELQEDDKYYSTIPAEVNQYSRPLPMTPVSEDEVTEHYSDLKLPTPEPTRPSSTESEPNSPYYLTLQSEDTPVDDASLAVAEA